MKTLIVLPSYNERQNIIQLVEALISLAADIYVCVVDDSSPDGTSELVQHNILDNPVFKNRVNLIVRSKKNGRGGAVRAGLLWGLNSHFHFQYFVEMDCDFSHEPTAVLKGLTFLEQGYDVALGCRYPNGIIIGWPLQRRIFSYLANCLAKNIIDRSIPDYTNGFRFYGKRALEIMLAHPQKFTGYIYLSESLSNLLKAKLSIKCFPITFKNRVRGVSNTSIKEIYSALIGLIQIALMHHFTINNPAFKND